jgi:A/G-specific adenine glycosylase
MLQQTQVATVVPYFRRFVARFPTIRALANARPQEVLRHWQGLGYYRRARNLLQAARCIVRDHGGRIPRQVDQLLELPGVGRYTAGAVASLAFDVRAPIVDGNVMRVLCRLDRISQDPRASATARWLWHRAQTLLPSKGVGDFNSALMELGATICTPRRPRCERCPVPKHCEARAAGQAQKLPVTRPRRPRTLERRWTFCIHSDGRWLVERRPLNGRWAGMWQFVTVAATSLKGAVRLAEARTGLTMRTVRRLGGLHHDLSHRRYRFEVMAAQVRAGPRAGAKGRWLRLAQMAKLPMPKPQITIREMLT